MGGIMSKRTLLLLSTVVLMILATVPSKADVNLVSVIQVTFEGGTPVQCSYDWSHSSWDWYRENPNPYLACFASRTKSDAQYEVLTSECIIDVMCEGSAGKCPYSFRGLTPPRGEWDGGYNGETRRRLNNLGC